MNKTIKKTSLISFIWVLFMITHFDIKAQTAVVSTTDPYRFEILAQELNSDVEGYFAEYFKQILNLFGGKEQITQFTITLCPKRGECNWPITVSGNKLNELCIAMVKKCKSGDKILVSDIRTKGINGVHTLRTLVIDIH